MTLLVSVIGEGGAWAQQVQSFTPPAESEVEYYHTDVIGSVRLVTNQVGQVTKRQDFSPYGTPLTDVPSSAQPRGFAGKERDDQTGFDYFGGRYLLSNVSRFTTVDPVLDEDTALVDPQRWNRYVYVRNNPLVHTDPDGRCLWDACVGEVAVVLGVSYATAAALEAAVAFTAVAVSPVGRRIATGMAETAASVVAGAGSAIANASQAASAVANDVITGAAGDKPSLLDPRATRHVLDGDRKGGGHRAGTQKPGKSEFPSSWSDEKILGEISDVATDPAAVVTPGKYGSTITKGTRDGIDVEVIMDKNGRIVTGYPTNVPRNPPR